MIVSHKHKFIFLKTAKTAGTSIEIGLSKHCGKSDVITPIVPEDEKLRRKLDYPGPRNYLLPIHKYRLCHWRDLALKRRLPKLFYHHIPARAVRTRFTREVWNSYYKFCFERNPWDRVISHYFWIHRNKRRPTLLQYLRSKSPHDLKEAGYDIYTIDGEVVVDRVCRFEAIADEMEFIRQRLDIPEPLELPRTKSKHRKEKRHYREVLGDEERELIRDIFSEEIELMGYEY